jgi:hypothetical protein
MTHHEGTPEPARNPKDLLGGPDPTGQQDVLGGADPDRQEDELRAGNHD